MVFANLIFLYIFLPVNFLLYFLTRNQTWRNIILIGFSLFFYAWGEPVWITLLLFSATIDFFHGKLVEANRGKFLAKVGVASSLVLNLGLLFTFKYSGFLFANINALLGTHFVEPAFALPIGISFYTFQTISYTVDVYRGDVKAQHNYLTFLLFVSLYHRLVAGPIVRYSEVEHEVGKEVPKLHEMSEGMGRFCVGLVKKVVVANYAGELVGIYLTGDMANGTVLGTWFGMLMYSIQLYYDFSGYSDMALGLGRMFGSHYYENFNYPYIARSVTEFWRRWHISLSGFFRDYVYIPLGGNRRRAYFNLMVVWMLTGLWHGASWNFILWGLYFGVFILLERLFLGKILQKIPRVFSHLYLILIVIVGWTMFYFEDFTQLGQALRNMFGLAGVALGDLNLWMTFTGNVFFVVLSVAFCAPILPWIKQKLYGDASVLAQARLTFGQGVLNVLMLLICTALLVGESYNPFLYFRF